MNLTWWHLLYLIPIGLAVWAYVRTNQREKQIKELNKNFDDLLDSLSKIIK